jgi:hypothetical protein
MKINELLVENEQLDELNLRGLGSGVGKAIGGVAGGVVQGAKNVWSGMKQGYNDAQAALSPDNGTGTPQPQTTPPPPNAQATSGAAPAQTGGPGEVATKDILSRAIQGTAQDPANQTQAAPAPAPTTPAQGTAPAPAQGAAAPAATDQQSKVGVGQINKIIPTLRTRDLSSVKKTVDATLAKKAPAAAAPAATPAAAPTQAEIDADRARLMSPDNGGANESKIVKFKSKFLGMDI